MVRRKSTTGEQPSWMTEFDPGAWPGRCVMEQFASWRAAVADTPTRLLDAFPLLIAARRSAEGEHVDCPAHPPQSFWPSSWSRSGGLVRFTVEHSDGSTTEEEVIDGSARDVELMDAYGLHTSSPRPSRAARTPQTL